MGLDIQKSNSFKVSQPQPTPQAQPAQPATAPQTSQAKPATKVVDGFDDPKKAPVSLSGEAKATSGIGLPSWMSGSALKEVGGKLWGQVTDKLGLESNIKKLGDGDKYSFAMGADASVAAVLGGTVYGKGKVEVERKDEDGKPKYTVSVEAEAGLGAIGELGSKTGVFGSASATLQQTYGAASKVEFSFDTPEEAARAAEILAKQGLVSANPSLMPFVGPSAQEYEFLQKNLSSIELRGNSAIQLAGDLGIGNADAALTGVFAEGNAKLETGLKIEFENGSPSAVVVKSGGEVEVKGAVAAGRGTVAGGKVSLSQETTYELPQGLSLGDFASDPAGAVRKVGGSLQQVEQKLIVQEEFEGSGPAGSGGFRAQAEYSGKPGMIPVEQIARRAASGDFGGALSLAGDQVNVDLTVAPYTSQGFNFSPSVSFFGTGAGVDIAAQAQNAHPWQFQGTATQAVAALNQQLPLVPDWHKYIIV